MPRRKKAELLDLINYIIQLYEREKLGFRDIEARLKAEGYDIGRSSIHRAYKDYRKAAEEYNKKFDEINALLTTLKDRPTTDMLEAVTAIIAKHVTDFVKDIESIEFEDTEALVRVTRALSQMADRLQSLREERISKAMQEIEKEAKLKGIDQEFIRYVRKEIFGT
ncbi:phage protein Gp27 family protein [Thermodesulfovibrio thiophilus]|uniref:phage protein Gp27 family protein n=1 Tax=Thermodesulfovibrio thiophilus TaxID=340095 RepID=UPI0003F4ED6E|nr:phage protein Gp27 family protein [Thermodesulfovibrio thiophilus]